MNLHVPDSHRLASTLRDDCIATLQDSVAQAVHVVTRFMEFKVEPSFAYRIELPKRTSFHAKCQYSEPVHERATTQRLSRDAEMMRTARSRTDLGLLASKLVGWLTAHGTDQQGSFSQ